MMVGVDGVRVVCVTEMGIGFGVGLVMDSLLCVFTKACDDELPDEDDDDDDEHDED
jgi:hypothetical protein